VISKDLGQRKFFENSGVFESLVSKMWAFDTRALTDISILDGSPRNKELEEGVGATIAKVRSTNGLMAKISVGSKFPWVQNFRGFKIP